MRELWIAAALAAVGLLAGAPSAGAADLIRVDVGGGAIVASGNDFPELAEDLLKQQDAFAGLVGMPSYTATVDYLGVAGAIQLTATGSGTSVTLSIPSTATMVSFSGASPGDVENQIQDWIQQNGASTWAEFLQEVNARSPLGLLDGNPRSTTALMTRSAFRKFGMQSNRTRLGYREEEVARWGAFGLRADAGGSTIDIDGFSSLYTVDGGLTLAGELGRHVGLSFSVLGQYRDYDGAESYDLGLELALPLFVKRPDRGLPITWSLTPVVQSAAGVSVDLAAGGLFVGGGLVSALALQMGPLELLLGNALLYYGGVPIDDIEGYDFETEVDQLVTRHGFGLTWYAAGPLYLDAGASVTGFLLDDAAVDVYASPFAGVGVRLGSCLDARIGYEVDVGDDYTAHEGRLELDVRF